MFLDFCSMHANLKKNIKLCFSKKIKFVKYDRIKVVPAYPKGTQCSAFKRQERRLL
jgi:hypothetical protein